MTRPSLTSTDPFGRARRRVRHSAWRWPALLLPGLCLGCSARDGGSTARAPARFLFVWAGPHGADRAGAEDFVAVLDVDTASATYGRVLATRAVGTAGAMAHHTELALPTGGPLFASDYETGQIFLLDVSTPLAPRVTARIDHVPGYRRPHSFARLPNGHVLATLQYGDGSRPGDPGGLAEFDAAGRLLRTRSAADAAFPAARIRPNGVELLPAVDRAVTTSMPMDDERTADVVQVWRLSDLRLLHTLALPVVAGDTVTHMPYDSRGLPDGHSVMVNTYDCALYRLSAVDAERPRLARVRLARPLRGEGCAVTAVVGHFLVVPAATAHEIVSVDVTDAGRPAEVSVLRTDATFFPHWVGVDPGSDRLVINSSEQGEPRVLLAHLDRATGRLSWDTRFREAGAGRPGVTLDHDAWRRAGRAPIAHAAVFGAGR